MINTVTIILTLFGAYIIRRGGEISTKALIELLKPFDLSENAIRLALSRMYKQGLFKIRKSGRKSYYSLTKKGNDWMTMGKQYVIKQKDKYWEGDWYIIVYNIPEDKRESRDRLRNKLKERGFGSIGNATWISPYNIDNKIKQFLRSNEISRYVEYFKAEYIGEKEGKDFANRVWKIKDVEYKYEMFLKKYSSQLRKLKRKTANSKLIDKGFCFAQQFLLTTEYIDIAISDPMLPKELLSKNWAGMRAKKLFYEYEKLLSKEANKFVDWILSNEMYK